MRLSVTLLAFSGRLAAGGDQNSAHDTAREAIQLLQYKAERPSAGALEWNEYANALLKVEWPDLRQIDKALQLSQRASCGHCQKESILPGYAGVGAISQRRSGAGCGRRAEALALLPRDASGGLHDELASALKQFLSSQP